MNTGERHGTILPVLVKETRRPVLSNRRTHHEKLQTGDLPSGRFRPAAASFRLEGRTGQDSGRAALVSGRTGRDDAPTGESEGTTGEFARRARMALVGRTSGKVRPAMTEVSPASFPVGPAETEVLPASSPVVPAESHLLPETW